jgi:hypothetical protein
MKNKRPNPLQDRDFFMSLIFIVWAASSFPDTFRSILFNCFELTPFRTSLLTWFFLGLCAWVILRIIKISNEELVVRENGEDSSVVEKVKEEFLQAKQKLDLQRAIFSLGLIPIREFILERFMDISNYGTFKASERSPLRRTLFNYLDVISYKKDTFKPSVRYLYTKNFKYIIVSKAERHEPFHKEEKRFPRLSDLKVLLIASNFFLLWFPIAFLMWPYHTIKRMFKKPHTASHKK